MFKCKLEEGYVPQWAYDRLNQVWKVLREQTRGLQRQRKLIRRLQKENTELKELLRKPNEPVHTNQAPRC